MSTLKDQAAAALRALIQAGKRRDELAKMAGLTTQRLIDYTLDPKHNKSIGIKSIRKLAMNIGMSFEEFLSYSNKCLESERVGIDCGVKLPLSCEKMISDKKTLLEHFNDTEFIEVALREATGSMGGGSMETGKTVKRFLKFRLDWVRSIPANPDNLSCIMAYGDSMSPTVTDGSVVLIDEGRPDFSTNKVFYLRYNGQMYLKRLIGRPGEINIVSDAHPEDAIQVVENDDFEIIGRALWMGRRIE